MNGVLEQRFTAQLFMMSRKLSKDTYTAWMNIDDEMKERVDAILLLLGLLSMKSKWERNLTPTM
jgi:hypothetical protein